MLPATFDPFALNLRQQAHALLTHLQIPESPAPPTSTPFPFLPLSHLQAVHHVAYTPEQVVPDMTPEAFVDVLSDLLELQPLAEKVAEIFRPLLMVLMARWLERARGGRDEWVRRLSSGVLIAGCIEEVWPIISSLLQTPTYSLYPPTEESLLLPPKDLHPLLLTHLRLLALIPSSLLPKHIISTATLRALFTTPHPDLSTRMLAVRAFSIHNGISESKRKEWEESLLQGKAFGQDDMVWYEGLAVIEGVTQEVWSDGWIWPLVEARRLDMLESAWNKNVQELYTPSNWTLSSSSLPKCLALAADRVLLFRPAPAPSSSSSAPRVNPNVTEQPHIPTPSTTKSLLALSLHLSKRSPIMLTSPPSSGKTHLLTYLSTLHFPFHSNPTLTISLADTSLDPKSLLGNYVSSPTDPGKFTWVEGALAKAVKEGRWVILEDIDKARGEVLALLGGLAEEMSRGTRAVGDRGSLRIPGREDVRIGDGFALFATRTIKPFAAPATTSDAVDEIDVAKPDARFPKPTFLNAQKFVEVFLEEPTKQEIGMILQARFPRLEANQIDQLMSAWSSAQIGRSTSGSGIGSGGAAGREVGLRDLMKWFVRVEALVTGAGSTQIFGLDGSFVNPIVQEEVFIEALDVFFGSLPKQNVARAIAVGAQLGLNEERAEWCMEKRMPEVRTIGNEDGGEVKAVRFGRVKLDCRKSAKAYHSAATERPYALTRPSRLLLEQIGVATSHLEPCLLVGETGTGKTTAVSYISHLLRRPLVSLNLSTQTESSDLLGGFKPLDPKIPAGELLVTFADLFSRTFSRKKNKRFEEVVRKAAGAGKWGRCVEMWEEAGRLARDRLKKKLEGVEEDEEVESTTAPSGSDTTLDAVGPRKRRKVALEQQNPETAKLVTEWNAFSLEVADFEIRHVKAGGRFVFSFVEGPLVKALRNGDWLLLDEVNLASPETLESLACILESPSASVVLTERGDLEPVVRHPDFRLFACMNPATDVGKKDLPASLRSRFTEIYVPSPDTDRQALRDIVKQYLDVADRAVIEDVAELYLSIKTLADSRQLADGSNFPPHYSMRTLARALTFASENAPAYTLRRALWEGFLMSFTMLLDAKSAAIVKALIQKHILEAAGNPQAILSQVPGLPSGRSADDMFRFGHFWLQRGPKEADDATEYVLTPSVSEKLIDLARVISTNRFPVLIQGPTSSGKTSAVEYLARRTGHRFVRINNHEHTDIQEYLGTYVSDPDTGKLVFQEGVLVRAVRRGDWIVLDELNLAPTDVLEALNRLLDDNRELVIPETQEVVRPHPHFMLFATQNPPGLYGGRKVLSRAFRNRFLEVHFDDVPQAELETIIHQRCRIAPSYARRIVSVFQELQTRRQAGRVFETKQSFATLRDLFRWAMREAGDTQQLAEHGYMLLAERARRADDKLVVKEVLEKVLKVSIDEKKLYDLSSSDPAEIQKRLGCPLPPLSTPSSIVWTSAIQRLYTLVAAAIRNNEPVLLVGETGCGKTSVCQLLASALQKQLFAVNCHQNMETADLLGGQKPIRNRAGRQHDVLEELRSILSRMDVTLSLEDTTESEQVIVAVETYLSGLPKPLSEDGKLLRASVAELKRSTALFEWHNGPLIEAMTTGDLILLDEVSLADDSVLERLNSVLEPARTLVLAEKGGRDIEQMTIVAADGFQVLATMNPGGDYGKKELSPALRNRFTEIWVPSLDSHDDLIKIVDSSWAVESLKAYSESVLSYLRWFTAELGESGSPVIGVRDILAWVNFTNIAVKNLNISEQEAFRHAAHMTVIDGLALLPQTSGLSSIAIQNLKNECVKKLDQTLGSSSLPQDFTVLDTPEVFSVGGFGVPKGHLAESASSFSLRAPTTCANAMRVLRGCQLPKPILLEGSPGVGKTSLITALASAAQSHLCRINLSDQTDLADLFGSDLPVEGGKPGEFAWKDAAFLSALQSGHWVLLDEMNLASQAVLEGLNAVLDHRGTVYIPELGRSFTRHPDFRIFAAQNPVGQGGGRKGLPKSFLNRFTRVYVHELTSEDLLLIGQHMYPDFSPELLAKMIEFNSRLHLETMVHRSFGRDGSPWEFNLRDVLRWLSLLHSPSALDKRPGHPIEHLQTIYLHRFRQEQDRICVLNLFEEIFAETLSLENHPLPSTTPSSVQFGHALLSRLSSTADASKDERLSVLQTQLAPLEAISRCLDLGWLIIVSGPAASGKSGLIRLLAQMSGQRLRDFPMNSGVDTMELLGSFEQADASRRMDRIRHRLANLSRKALVLAVFNDSEWSSLSAALDHLDEASLTIEGFVVEALAVLKTLEAMLGDPHSILDVVWVRSALQELSASSSTSGRFEWVDGELVQALSAGDWLVIDNANLCNASVLDRINSLCETNGTLVLSERGTVGGEPQILTPHPSFRLFMTLDPRHGELSRAMRNRGVEICLDAITSPYDLAQITRQSRQSLTEPSDLTSLLAHRALATFDTLPATVPRQSWSAFASQDSSLAGILPHLPTPVLESEQVASLSLIPQQVADLLHLLSSTAPSTSNIVRHVLALYDKALGLPLSSHLSTALQNVFDPQIIDLITQASKEKVFLPESFVRYQPIDPLSNSHISEASPRSLFISQMIELVTRTSISSASFTSSLSMAAKKFVNDLSVVEKSFLVAQGRKLPVPVDQVTTAIYPLISAFYATIERSLAPILTLQSPADEETTAAFSRSFSQFADLVVQLMLSTSAPVLDYSAVQVLVGWLLESAIRIPSGLLDPLEAPLQNLKDSITFDTGHGQQEIWLAYLRRTSHKSFRDLVHRLQALFDGVPTTHDNFSKLRSTALKLSATYGLDLMNNDQDDSSALHALEQDIEKALIELQDPESSPTLISRSRSGILATLSLDILSSLLVSQKGQNISAVLPSLQDLVHMAESVSSFPLQETVPLQHALWNIQALGHMDNFTSKDLLESWLKTLWLEADIPEGALAGPADLYRPTILSALLHDKDQDTLKLKDLPSLEVSSKQLATVLRIRSKTHTQSHHASSIDLLVRSIFDVCEAFATSYPEKLWETLQKASMPSTADEIENFVASLLSTSHSQLRVALQQHVVPNVESLFRRTQDNSSDMQLLGQAWVGLSIATLQLYVPAIPIDPAAAHGSELRLLQYQETQYEAELVSHRRAELEVTGNSSNFKIASKSELLWRVQQAIVGLGALRVDRETNVALLNTMFHEIHQFLAQVIDGSRVDALIANIASSSAGKAALEEDSLQSNIRGFLRRMDQMYHLFSDITRPIGVALMQLRTGFRILARDAEMQSALQATQLESTLVTTLTAFPTSLGIKNLRRSELPIRFKSKFPVVPTSKLLLLEVASVAYDLSLGISLDNQVVGALFGLFDQLSHLWMMDRERELQAQQEAESLYRQRKVDEEILSDIELEEKEFKELFPQYGDILDDDEAIQPTSATSQNKSAFIQTEQLKQIGRLHIAIFSTAPNQDCNHIYQSQRDDVIKDVFDKALNSLDDSIDDALAYQIRSLCQESSKRTSVPTFQERPYDFYSDANPYEMNKAVQLLNRLLVRLEDTLREWPDQMVLHHLIDRCNAILSLSLGSPIVRVIAAMEQLLLHTADWESFANRENSLKQFQNEIGGLIVSWRQLELSCWSQLLETQAVSYAEEASTWWFKLYEVLIQGGKAAYLEDIQNETSVAVENHIRGIVTLLDQYIASSSLGQYSARLHLLRCFTRFMSLLSQSTGNFPGLKRISRTLESITERFSLAEINISSSLRTQRAKIEGSVRDFIKLASWKDINVHALKASAQHTHRQLHRSIRKFREVLRQPCAPLLGAPDMLPSSQGPSTIAAVSTWASVEIGQASELALPSHLKSNASHLVNLSSTFSKFRGIFGTTIRPALSSTKSATIDELTSEILSTAKSLADETPGVANEENSRLIKNLLTRKRRAYGDLLKELRRIGLSSNLRSDVMSRQTSISTLHSLPTLSKSLVVSEALTQMTCRVDNYHFRLVVSMVSLRDSLRTHSPDITTRDLQRGIGFVESVLSVALDHRIRLASALEEVNELKSCVGRLSDIGASDSSEAIACFDKVSIPTLSSDYDTICRTIDALQETLESRNDYGTTVAPTSRGTSTEVASRTLLSACLQQATRIKEVLGDVLTTVKATPFAIFLKKDLHVIESCREFKQNTVDVLNQLSFDEPHFRQLYIGTLSLVDMLSLPTPSSFATAPQADAILLEKGDKLLNSLLVVAQELQTVRNVITEEDADADRFLTEESSLQTKASRTLRLPEILQQLRDLFTQPADLSTSYLLVQRIRPFLVEYATAAECHLNALASWTGANFKLTHVLVQIISNLALKGFCSPPEAEDAGAGEGDSGQTMEGSGMGEGTGNENVSEQIEDESQVEGLQGEDNEPQPKDKERNDGGAIEMSEDFGGEMEDVSADGSDEEDDDGSDEEEQTPDEQIGDVDPLDENAVDEKLWGDEKGEDDSKQDEHLDQDRSTEQTQNSDLVAKDDEKPRQEPGQEKPEGDAQDSEDQSEGEEAPEPEMDGEDEDGAAEDSRDKGEKMPDNVPEAETLDLPDSLDLGDEEGGDDEETQPEGIDDDPMDDMPEDQPPMPDDPSSAQKSSTEDDPAQPENVDEGEETTLPEPGADDTEIPDEDEDAPPESADQAQAEAGEEDAPEGAEEDQQVAKPKVEDGADNSNSAQAPDEPGDEAGQDDAPQDQEDGTKNDVGKQAQSTAADQMDESGDTENADSSTQPPPTAGESQGGQGEAVPLDESQANEQEMPQRGEEPNPMKNLGDTMKEIRRRLDEISEAKENENDTNTENKPEAEEASMETGEIEYAKEDDDEDMQALGPAPEDQTQNLSDLRIADDQQESTEISHQMDIDEEDLPKPEQPLVIEQPPELDQSADKALTESEVRQRGHQDQPPLDIEPRSQLEEEEDVAPLTEEEAKMLDQQVELINTQWLNSDRSSTSAEEMWRLYTSLTHDLSHSLCEQLRLILEPTLATRLKGDYRSGKRLNMKKIIPYVASEFTKDKIWLRRTRPSSREYQVLLALDDSRSMAESHSVHLAYETLALVSQAMTKLEVGDIGIAKFGEAFELLHGFEETNLSDDKGAQVMSRFKFDQKATNVLSLVERSLQVLADARDRRSTTSSTAADIWQLELIISDGICQDHEKLRTLLRKAAEQRVMIVFIIVDSLHRSTANPFAPAGSVPEPASQQRNSILSMKTATYETGPSVDGESQRGVEGDPTVVGRVFFLFRECYFAPFFFQAFQIDTFVTSFIFSYFPSQTGIQL
ncbi:AAA ATPase containing von Willebrand factor type A (vWA) domain [Phaffia rhodozyma]|uniref:Midasin n=1 Tax=Phaffia rhodozyma TaxID=264483 RepID=A0A0F7SRI6_PHARH|nr:AAA ATPase containing von Willebrand factor type A (vWA) domain [Phaffia rhodozyma]